MTVLQVCAYAAPYEGNFIKSLQVLGEQLEQQGIQMIYAFPETAESINWVQKLAKKTKVFFLPLAKAMIHPKTYSCLREIYKKYPDIAIVHTHFELYDIPVVLTAPKRVKVFWHLHDALSAYNSLRYRMIHKVQYGLLHRKAELLSVSKSNLDYVLNCGFPKAQALFFANGLDTNRVLPVCADLCRKYDFLVFGWDFHIKGIDLCIDAVLKYKINCRIAVVGGSEMRERISQQYGKIQQIDVIDPVNDVNILYGNAKCFLHISRAEGFSYALLEAVYAGLPVICSDISENLFAQRFPTVKMVKNGNVDSIAKAMVNQIYEEKVDREAVERAREMIEKNYSVNCWVKNILERYGVENA